MKRILLLLITVCVALLWSCADNSDSESSSRFGIDDDSSTVSQENNHEMTEPEENTTDKIVETMTDESIESSTDYATAPIHTHFFGEWIVISLPTCTEIGKSERKCSCGEVEIQETPAIGHQWEQIEEIVPTCQEKGQAEGQKCRQCGLVLGCEEIAPLGHDLIYVAEIAATCTDQGVTDGYRCSRCDYSEGFAIIDVLTHVPIEVQGYPATCTIPGMTGGTKCKYCNQTLQQQSIIQPTGHTIVIDSAMEPTYTTAGKTEGSHCSVCQTVIIPQKKVELTDVQKNSVAMLNYLALLNQEITVSQNSRMFLEEAYSALINNTDPECVDDLTKARYASLLDIIEKYRMIEVKRDRLRYLYDTNKEAALRSAVPNPISILNIVTAKNWKERAISALYLAVDSYTSYQSTLAEADSEFLKSNWELDDEASQNLHENRKATFAYMVDIVRDNSLPGKITLSETAVEEFVKWKNNDNLDRKLEFFERASSRDTYQNFGNYWLELASLYYDAAESGMGQRYYNKCVDAFNQYLNLGVKIFRKDYAMAETLPKVIVAAGEISTESRYVISVSKYLKLLEENTKESDWSTRCFIAQVYMDLYAHSNDRSYLEKAYDHILENVNALLDVQKEQNVAYLSDVKEEQAPADATKEQKKQIKDFNALLKEKRKTELSPVYEPLRLNLDYLFILAEQLNINDTEKQRIENILRGDGTSVFLNQTVDNKYSFRKKEVSVKADYSTGLLTDTLSVPASILSSSSRITVLVNNAGEETLYDDWKLTKVTRDGSAVTSFTAEYDSKMAVKNKWTVGTTVEIRVYANENDDSPVLIKLKVVKVPVIGRTVFEQIK